MLDTSNIFKIHLINYINRIVMFKRIYVTRLSTY